MAEKRFTITQDFEEHHRQIRDNGHIIMGCFLEVQAEGIVDLLNQLNDENEQLRNDCSILVLSNQEYRKENEELKQFKDNVFDLIDKNIKETKELFEDGTIDLISYNDAMIILIGLKEELKGDVE